MESKFQLIEEIDDTSSYAVAGGCVYSIVNGRIHPPIRVLNELIEQTENNNQHHLTVSKLRMYLRGYGNLLCFYFGAYYLDINSVCVDVTEHKILHISYTKDYKQPRQNIDIAVTSHVHTVLYQEEEAIFPLGMRNEALKDSEAQNIRTIKRGDISQLEDGKYLFSRDKGANILNRIDSAGNDIWQRQATGQYKGVTNQILYRNGILDILGVTDDTLWYSEYNNAIVGVDINTGKLVHRIENATDSASGGLSREIKGKPCPIRRFSLSPDKLKIIAVQFLIYAELNLQDAEPQFKTYPLDAELQTKGIDLSVLHQTTISGGKVLLHNPRRNTELDLILGVFDTSTRTITSMISLDRKTSPKSIKSCRFLNGQYYLHFEAHNNTAGKLIVLELGEK